jgi:hypothetical protein
VFTFTSTPCSVIFTGESVQCVAPPGAGTGHAVLVLVDGVPSHPFPNATLAYEPPSILSISPATPLSNGEGLPTAGGIPIVIQGVNFGSASLGPAARIAVTYVPSGGDSPTTLSFAHDLPLCCCLAVDGGNMLFFAPHACTSTVHYRPPRVVPPYPNHVTCSPLYPPSRCSYSPVDLSITLGSTVTFFARGCNVTRDHVELTCLLGSGVGVRAQWTVSVANQSSSNPRTSYRRPEVSAVLLLGDDMQPRENSALALQNLDTRGGQVLAFRGDYFGPSIPFIPREAVGRQAPAGVCACAFVCACV